MNPRVVAPTLKVPDYKWSEEDAMFESSVKYKEVWMDFFFMSAFIWTFGSILNESAKLELEVWLKKQLEQRD